MIKPVEPTDATAEFELDHVTLDAGEPSILADACTEVPDAMGLVGTDIDREGEGSVLDPPPQAARVTQNAAPIAETVRIWRSPSVGLQPSPSTRMVRSDAGPQLTCRAKDAKSPSVPFGGSASWVLRDASDGVAKEARTRGFAAPAFAGCAFSAR